jgi:hypothetical protein
MRLAAKATGLDLPSQLLKLNGAASLGEPFERQQSRDIAYAAIDAAVKVSVRLCVVNGFIRTGRSTA